MRTTVLDIQKLKQRGERVPMITAYDYTSAQIADRAGIPLILVGDSLGNVVQGQISTVAVTIVDIIYHARMVVRGSQQALVIGDMPFLTYTNEAEAITTARRLMQQAGVQAVKMEGGAAVVSAVRRLTELGVPVMGHLGYTPQSEHVIGRRVQGKKASDARRIIEDAQALEAAGAFGIVLELVPAPLAAAISTRLRIPTIGIGAGAGCDGQVQVWHDLLGLYADYQPRHAKQYLTLADTIAEALGQYASDVRAGSFPTAAQSSTMDEHELRAALEGLSAS